MSKDSCSKHSGQNCITSLRTKGWLSTTILDSILYNLHFFLCLFLFTKDSYLKTRQAFGQLFLSATSSKLIYSALPSLGCCSFLSNSRTRRNSSNVSISST